jgi:hypothetical protein
MGTMALTNSVMKFGDHDIRIDKNQMFNLTDM